MTQPAILEEFMDNPGIGACGFSFRQGVLDSSLMFLGKKLRNETDR